MANLRRDSKNAVIGGVCSGLAKVLGLDVTLIRLLFVAAFILAGTGPLLYLILWLLIPDGE